MGILCARALRIKAVATPVSCNSAVELSGLFDAVRRTRIGSPFVIEAMNCLSAEGLATVCGYGANGGFLLGSAVDVGKARLSALPTRTLCCPSLPRWPMRGGRACPFRRFRPNCRLAIPSANGYKIIPPRRARR